MENMKGNSNHQCPFPYLFMLLVSLSLSIPLKTENQRFSDDFWGCIECMKWLKAFNLINSKTDLESYLSFFRKYSLLLPIRCTILVLRHTKSFRIINSTNFQNMALISSMEIREMNTLTN